MQTKSSKSKANSTKLIDIPPLITVWLQAGVLPGQLRRQRLLKFALDYRITSAHFREADGDVLNVRTKAWTRKQKRANGNRLVRRCGAASTALISLRSPVRFALQPCRMRDGHLPTLLPSSFLVFHTNDFSPAGLAQSDNQLFPKQLSSWMPRRL